MNTLKYQTVLFDFHGVFTSNVGRTTHALVNAMNDLGIIDRSRQRELLSGLLSRSLDIPARQYITENAPSHATELQEGYAQQNEMIYVPQYSWLIQVISRMGANVAIVSNGRHKDIAPQIENWGLSGYVNQIYARGENGQLSGKDHPRKPSPDPIETALADMKEKGFRVNMEKVLFVGDHEVDVVAAREAGIFAAQIVSGPEQLNVIKHNPDYYLTLHHLRIDKEINKHNGIPIIPMRELPDIVAGERVGINPEILGSRSGKERM